ncbi:MAG: aspartate aminotransferase family protein [Thermoleophilia bacterium]|nr:aspartate aminotransferase family protein [Thermoleophilia bacterium]
MIGTDLTAQAKAVTEREIARYAAMTPGSQRATARAKRVLPLGVASNFQFFDPHPVVMVRGQGSRLWDVDGNEYTDYNMGYGSLLAGHSHPLMVEALRAQAPDGTLFVTPSPLNTEVAEELCRRFPLDMVRFTNSGTEATMDALRLARAATGREMVVKVEGCYHGHHDLVMVSVKPPLDQAGPADSPNSVPFYGGIAGGTVNEVVVVPYNDLTALERAFAAHPNEIAAFILEPVPENMGIVLPDEGYLTGAVEIAHGYGALVVFDEVKTGITAHPKGASALYGAMPDLVCLAKSIGGGVPVGAFGGRREIMQLIADGAVAQQGTFNGNPLVMAAARSVLTQICTAEAWAQAKSKNDRLIAGCQSLIDQAGLPAHTVALGAKGCVTYAPDRVRNYRDYKNTDFDLAYAHWIYMMTHGIFLPPGLDEQWLVSVQHTDEDIDKHLEIFADFVREVTA